LQLLKLSKICLICLTVTLAAILQACSFTFPTGPDFSDEIDQQSQVILEALLNKDISAIKPLLVPEFLEIDGYEGLFKDQIFDLLPDDKSIEEVFDFYTEERIGNEDISKPYPLYLSAFELEKDDEWVLLRLYVRKLEGEVLLQHLKVRTFAERPSTMNNFNLSQKGFKHYAFLATMIGVFLFIVFSLYKLVRDKQIPRKTKWLWFIFIMLGYWGATMNWTTGDISNSMIQFWSNGTTYGYNYRILDLNFLGAGFRRMGLLQPWIMKVGIPIGAIVYWFKRYAQ